MTHLLAIDPGPEQSAWVVYNEDTGQPVDWLKDDNRSVLNAVASFAVLDDFAIEMVASYGMAVGKDVFETCVWIGRFIERWRWRYRGIEQLVYRREVKIHLCGSMKAKDSNIRQALIDRYGPGKEKAIGKKASPGPLYGMSGDCWSALAVAVTAAETRLDAREAA